MNEDVDVPRTKDKTPAKLEGIFAQFVLPVAGGVRPATRRMIHRAQHVKDGTNPKIQSPIGNAIRIDQQRERDAGFLAKEPRVLHVAQAYGGNARALELKAFFPFAQLRDMLAAKQSPIVAQKCHHTWLASPQRSKPYGLTLCVRQDDFRELRA